MQITHKLILFLFSFFKYGQSNSETWDLTGIGSQQKKKLIKRKFDYTCVIISN